MWWRDIHQLGTLANPTGIQMDGVLRVAFAMGFVAFSLIAASLIRRRFLLAAMEHRLYEVLETGAGAIAGDAISSPRLETAPEASGS